MRLKRKNGHAIDNDPRSNASYIHVTPSGHVTSSDHATTHGHTVWSNVGSWTLQDKVTYSMEFICVVLPSFVVSFGFDTEDRTIFPSGHLIVQRIHNETIRSDTESESSTQ